VIFSKYEKRNRIKSAAAEDKEKACPVRIVAWFRVLLWWGAEMARQVFVYKKPGAQIVHVRLSESQLPLSSWAFTPDEGYCLVSDRQARNVEIHSVSQISQN